VIVADASAVVELLLRGPAAEAVEPVLLGEGTEVQVPHLLDLEVVQVIRRWAAHGAPEPARAEQAVRDLVDLPFVRQPHDLLVPRIWELRHNLTAYDAAYLALAELLDATLVTFDAGLAAIARRTVAVVDSESLR
jgi:predicted nucleic acid-binding protein